jgi:hypothetical protein
MTHPAFILKKRIATHDELLELLGDRNTVAMVEWLEVEIKRARSKEREGRLATIRNELIRLTGVQKCHFQANGTLNSIQQIIKEYWTQ